MQKIAGGKEAEVEYDISVLHKIIEEEILYKNLLSNFAPMIIALVRNSLSIKIRENNIFLYKSAILTLCKFMCISKRFCEENLPLLFEILESEEVNANLKLNVCVAFGDLVNRFPNTLQKEIKRFFNCLKSKNVLVVRYSMIVISHLVLNDMLKLSGEIVEICLLLESEDQKLKDLVNLFFFELNKKGNNAIYNVIPKALTKLNSEYKHMEFSIFQNIVKNLLKYVEKDKHTDGLIDKLFTKLKGSSDVNDWRNTTYCLSLLNCSEKGFNKILELYQNLKEKIDDEIVNENFQTIFNKLKKGPNINKENVEEMEKKFFAGEKMNLVNTNRRDRTTAAKNNNKIGSKRTHSNITSTNNIRKKSNRIIDEESELSEKSDYESDLNSIAKKRNNIHIQPQTGRSLRHTRGQPKPIYIDTIEDDDDFESD